MPLKQLLAMEPNRTADDSSSKTARKPVNFAKKKDKFGRKRSQSFSGVNSKFCAPYKYRAARPTLPTKFLLGGNICDPLNLNSLQDEEVNRTVNAITPKSSPVPTPPQRRGHIEVIIPPNIHDPLNLIDCADDAEYEQQLTTSPLKKGSKRRKKKKRTSSATTEPSDADISAAEARTPDLSNDSAKIPELEPLSVAPAAAGAKEKVVRDLRLELTPPGKEKKRKFEGHSKEGGVKKLRRMDSMDKIVSPVVPQPGAWLKRALQFNRSAGQSSSRGHQAGRPSGLQAKESGGKVPQFRDKNKAYQYGNYNRYYGYRNPNHEVDSRLRCFAAHRHIFEGRDILDIGCNIGHITLSIARDFGAKSVVGIDIDKKLIGIARKNVCHYVNCNDSPRDEPGCSPRVDRNDKCFPISMPILYGPVDVPGMQNDERRGRGFPHNVTFVQGNYVLEDDSLLSTEQPQFDVILCLSITKWLHLNWGDAGLKQAFRRMYAQLKPGGQLILEPQSWASYKHKKTLTETIYKHYNSIEFFPEKFTQYLLSSEVGFAKSEIMGQPHHPAKGFQRPIQVFTRSNLSPSQSQRSYSVTPSHTNASSSGGCRASGGAGKQVYTCLPSPDVCTEERASARVDLGTSREAGGSGEAQLEPGQAGAGGEAQLEPVQAGTGQGRDVGSTGKEDGGVGKEQEEDQLAGSNRKADGGDSESRVGVGSVEKVQQGTDRAKSDGDTQRETGSSVDERDNGSKGAGERETDNMIADRREKGSRAAGEREIVCKIADNRAKIAEQAKLIHRQARMIHRQARDTDRVATIVDKPEPASKIASKAGRVSKIASKAERVSKIADKRAEITDRAEQASKIADKAERVSKITNKAAKVSKIADSRAKVADKQATLTEQAEMTDKRVKLADKQATITDKPAKITEQAQMADNQAQMAENQAKRTENQAQMAENQAKRTENQAKMTENQAKMTDNQAKTTEDQAKEAENQAKMTENQARLAHKSTDSPDNQTTLPSSPINPAKPLNSPHNPAKLSNNPAKPCTSPINPTKLPSNPHNQPATPTNTSFTPESRPESPHNRAPSPTMPFTHNKCKKTREFPTQSTADDTSNNMGCHLASTTCAKKRKHTALGNPNSDSKRHQFVSPVKRKPTDRRDIAYAKRKNDERTAQNDAGTRLDDSRSEEITTDCESSAAGKSSTEPSTQYRVMQQTKCMMDNT